MSENWGWFWAIMVLLLPVWITVAAIGIQSLFTSSWSRRSLRKVAAVEIWRWQNKWRNR